MPEIGDIRTVPRLLAWRRSVDPDRVAIEVHGVTSLTFARWDSDSDAVASALRHQGIQPGTTIGLIFDSRDWTDFAVAYCGVQKAGAVAVPISDRLAPAQLERMLTLCSAALVVRGRDDVAKLVAQGTQNPAPAVDSQPDDLAQILFTSGTGGEPKGVGATHANLTLGVRAHPKRLALAHSERFLHAFPVGTNAGQTMLLNALSAKPAALTLPQFTPRRFAQLLPTVGTVFVVPAMAIESLNSGALSGLDLSGVHLVGSTAAPLPPAVASRLAEAFPKAAVVNYYTSTEAAPAQVSMIFDPRRPDAVGRAAAGTVMITDDAGEPVPDGVLGQVWLRNPHPRRYLGGNGGMFRGDWVRMGDVGRLEDGYLYLSDRDGDVVKSGAHKVSTLEIEAALYDHPDIADAAVIGVPHPVLGTALVAAIVARSGTVTLPGVRAFLAERLADYQLPSKLMVLDSLPRNDAGKVLKRQLAAQFDLDPGSR